MDKIVSGPSIGEFFSVVWEDWGSRVSGTLSVPFTALMLYAKADYARAIWGVLAFVGIVATIYQVWARERKTVVELQTELNSVADLRGRIEMCVQENPPAYVVQAFPGTNLQYFCECSNHGREACTISYLVIEVAPASGIKSEHKVLVQPAPKHLEYTDAFKYEGICRIPVIPEDVAGAKVNVYLLDSLGKAHRNPVTKFYPSCSSKAML